MKYLRLWMLVLVAIGGAALFACGGDSSDDGANGDPTSEATSDGGEEPTDDGSSDSGDGDSGSELQSLAAGLGDNEAKITYDFSSPGGEAGSTGSFTIFYKSAEAWRVDMELDGGDAATFIEKEGTTYLCSGDGSGGGQCLAYPGAFPLPFLTFFTEPDALTGMINAEVGGIGFDKSDDTIGGQDATCYSASGTVEGETGFAEYCFSDDGVMLRFGGGSDAATAFTMEATSVESSVSDADLELPYEVMDITIPGT